MSDDDLHFLDEDEPDLTGKGLPAGAPWRVLVVDDEPDVHSMTRFVLKNFRYRGRGLQLFEAGSAQEARRVLSTLGEMAVMLVDVVMESEHAGLELISHVRDVMGHTCTRIVLRTGQPGAAPERQVILTYDINDYKSKAELSADKLFATMVAALRSYENLKALEEARQAERLARLDAEAAHQERMRLEQRKSVERQVELLAISQILSAQISPRLASLSEMAGTAHAVLRATNENCHGLCALDAGRHAAAELCREIAGMGEMIDELTVTLATIG